MLFLIFFRKWPREIFLFDKVYVVYHDIISPYVIACCNLQCLILWTMREAGFF
jgi:hypothetical protein